jgi:polyvinyl alcohol dehydrogenase (cytochrome)
MMRQFFLERVMKVGLVLAGVIGVVAIAAVLGQAQRVAAPAAVSGEATYKEFCASCHDHPGPRVPPRSALQQLSVGRILHTLDFGVMMNVAYPMQRSQREAVAKFLGRAGEDAGPAAAAFCSNREISWAKDAAGGTAGDSAGSWTGWSPSDANLRFQSLERGGLNADSVRKLKLKWAYGFAGDITAFAAATIRNGTLFVGSASGVVQAMNAKTGCLYWTFQADGPVRAATTIAKNGAGYSIVFGDLTGWFYSLDAATGKLLWKRRVDGHEATRLTGAAAEKDGVVFEPAASWEETRSGNPKYPCCTFRGSVSAFRVSDGSVLWKTYMVGPATKTGKRHNGEPLYGPSGAGIWAAPTVDAKRGLLYVATGDNFTQPPTDTSDAVIALKIKTGETVWKQQMTRGDVYSGGVCEEEKDPCGPDLDFGASAMLVRVGERDVIVAGQKSGLVYGLDAADGGKILWQARAGKGGFTGGVQWGMASDGANAYVAVSDVMKLEGEMGDDPPVLGGANFDPVAGGGLTAFRVLDGEKIWFAKSTPCAPPRPGCSPAQSGALTAVPGAVFSGSLDGHIRAFSARDGAVIWDFDTEREYSTVNGVAGKGGSLDGAGPVIVDGMVYVNSGYPRFGGAPGNVLLAFGVE